MHNNTPPAPNPTTQVRERTWFIALGSLCLLAIIGHWLFPLTPDRVAQLLSSFGLHAHLGGHHFVDTRSWLGIPNALDVLSNLPFAVFGIWGLRQVFNLNRTGKLNSIQVQVFSVFFIGLLLTTVGSSFYHYSPSDSTLLWDRAGMAIAFAGVLGIAASERISTASGRFAVRITGIGATLALWVWHSTGDVLPWSIVQFGGVALVLVLACIKPLTPHLGVSLFTLIAWYALAKIFESNDAMVFEITQHWVGGHSLKHIVASLAALPVLAVLEKASATK